MSQTAAAETVLEMMYQPSTPITDSSPAPPPNRRLWSSPAFSQHSDYYSGEDGDFFSPESSFLKSAHSSFNQTFMRPGSQNQRVLLERLGGIAKAILASPDLTEHHFQLIHLDVDRLEQTIAAPDSQTREPADVADSGLFLDDEDEDEGEDEDDVTEVAVEQDTKSVVDVALPAHNETNELVTRVVKVAEDLNKRFVEMKKLHRSAESQIRDLKEEMVEHENKHHELYDEVSQYHTDFLYLKLSLKSLEVRVDSDMEPKIRHQFLADIDRWKTQWKKSTERIRVRRMGNKATHDSSIDDETPSLRSYGSSRRRIFMNGSPKSRSRNSSITNLSPQTPRTPNMAFRLSSSNRHVSAPLLSETEMEPRQTELPPLVQEDESSQDEHEEPTTDDQTVVEEEEDDVPVVRKSAWEQLWDELADFAGIHDPDY